MTTENIEFNHLEITLDISEYNEASSYCSDNNWSSNPVRYISVKRRDGTHVKSFKFPRQTRGRGQAEQRKKQVNQVIAWFYAYSRLAKHPKDVRLQCDAVGDRYTHKLCNHLRIASDNTARCNLSPHSFGYTSGGKADSCRNLPNGLQCDIFEKSSYIGKESLNHFPLTMFELHECLTGKATKKLNNHKGKNEND